MSDEEFYLEDLKSKFRKLKNVGGYDKYYLSYSGGKDSHFLYWFLREYSYPEFKDIKIVGINTYMEHHDILKRIIANSDVVLVPKIKPQEIKEKINGTYHTGFNISKKARDYVLSGDAHKITHLCCHELKKNPARKFEKETGLKPILGIRGGESSLRKKQYTTCFTKDKKFTPLHDLSDELLDKIYIKYNIELPDVYNHICRTGCMGCPYGSYKHDTEKELLLINDRQFDFVTEYFKESYEVLGIDVEEIRRKRQCC